MSWVKLDDQWYDHPKFLGVPDLAQLLWVKALTYVCRHRLKGIIPADALRRLTSLRNPTQLVNKLVSAGLWIPIENGYRIHDFDQYQMVSEKTSEARSSAGKLGAAKRWQADQPPDSNCYPVANSKPIAGQLEGDGSRADARRDGTGSSLGSGSDPEGDTEGGRSSGTRKSAPPVTMPREESVYEAKLRSLTKLSDLDVRDLAGQCETLAMTKGTKTAWLLAALDEADAKSQRGELAHVRHARVVGFIRHAKAPKAEAPVPGEAKGSAAYREDDDPEALARIRRQPRRQTAQDLPPQPPVRDFEALLRGFGTGPQRNDPPMTEAERRAKVEADKRLLEAIEQDEQRKAGTDDA